MLRTKVARSAAEIPDATANAGGSCGVSAERSAAMVSGAIRCAAQDGPAGMAAGGSAHALVLRGRGMRGWMRSCGQALDATGRAGQGRKHQEEDQREGELGAAQHWIQCNVRRIGLDLHRESYRQVRHPDFAPCCPEEGHGAPRIAQCGRWPWPCSSCTMEKKSSQRPTIAARMRRMRTAATF